MLKRLARQKIKQKYLRGEPLWPQDLIEIFLPCAHVEVRKSTSVHTGLADGMSPALQV